MNPIGLRVIVRKIISESLNEVGNGRDMSEAEIWRDYYHDNWIMASNTIKKMVNITNESSNQNLRNFVQKCLLDYWQELSPLHKSDNFSDIYN